MSVSFSSTSLPFSESSFAFQRQPHLCSNPLTVASNNFHSVTCRGRLALNVGGTGLCRRFRGFKLWVLERLNFQFQSPKQPKNRIRIENNLENSGLSNEKGPVSDSSSILHAPDGMVTSMDYPSLLQTGLSATPMDVSGKPSLCISVIGATGELAKSKIFPALFALYYSGFLPENVGIFGYSRKDITDEDLRSIIASTLTCRVDHQENCADKLDAFLRRTYHINGGCDNKYGMSMLNARMEQIEGGSKTNRIFYLSVPQEAVLDVTACLSSSAQTQKGWNRIIFEKPFGFDALSSYRMTQYLLSNFEEKQIYRIDHLLGRNLIENLTVLRFSNLVFEPLWSRTYIDNVQVILSEDLTKHPGRYFSGYGIIRDIVHSHILQTIALLAMEPPVSLDGEDIRNEKVKVLRSIRKLEPKDVILGQYRASGGAKVDTCLNGLTPTYFAAALYIDNARWDGVPFFIKTGLGLIKHQMEIRIQFRNVPGNVYRECMGHNMDRAVNELILRDVPDEAILVRVNNKVPGLGLQLDSSELNLLYKDKYNMEVPDSYEQLLLDVIDGDNHLFMRSDELEAAWNILTPILNEIDKENISVELYEMGGRGPVGAYYLIASSQLSSDFYATSCPTALSTIKSAVKTAVSKERRMGASLLRLHFHDCFVNGCDASVLLDDTSSFTGEKSAAANVNSLRGFDVIDDIKSQLESACPGIVSCADILAVAARDSVVALGGSSWTVGLGRRDSTTASKDAATTDIPSPQLDLSDLITAFSNKGFTTKEMVVLSGAHTTGQAKCQFFRGRIYNESNIDSDFATSTQSNCPSTDGDSNLSPLDVTTNVLFDNAYFKNLVNKKGLLHSDQQLFSGGSTDSQVTTYSTSSSAFYADFSSAMVKMGNLSPLTGTSGQIRTNCRLVN